MGSFSTVLESCRDRIFVDTVSSRRSDRFADITIKAMSEAARKLLHAFESLTEAERHEVAREILRLTALAEHDPLEDDALVIFADEVLLELDRGETRKSSC